MTRSRLISTRLHDFDKWAKNMIRKFWFESRRKSNHGVTHSPSNHSRRIRRVFHDFSAIQHLEVRALLSAVTWTGLGDGSNWNDPTNWSGGAVPTAADDVSMNAPLTISSGVTITFNSLTLDNANLTLAGGSINGGTIHASGSGKVIITSAQATLDHVTLNCDLDLSSTSAVAWIKNGLTLNGTATLGPSAGLNFQNSQTLSGNGTVVIRNQERNGLFAVTNDMTLTIGPDITVSGGSSQNDFGLIGAKQSGGATNVSIIVEGTILANIPGTRINLSPSGTGTVNVTGTLRLDGGGIQIKGNSTRESLGTIQYVSGGIYIAGTYNNTGRVLELNGTTGSWFISKGTILGGTISTSEGAKLFATDGGYLNGVTLYGELDLTTTNCWIEVMNGLTLNGTATLGNGSDFRFAGNQTLGGNGTIVFQNVASNRIEIVNSGSTLTIGPDITIQGGGVSASIGYTSPSDHGEPGHRRNGHRECSRSRYSPKSQRNFD
jgi:hypothetical protein